MVKPNMRGPQPPRVHARRVSTATETNFSESGLAGASAQSTALFIAQMTAELAQLARFGGLDPLTYLLDMARIEAEIYCPRAGTQERASHG